MAASLYTNNRGLECNQYDCTPCPKCGSTYRYPWPNKDPKAQCDDCGHIEPWTTENGKPEDYYGK